METIHLNEDQQKRFSNLQFKLSLIAKQYQSPGKVLTFLIDQGEKALIKKREK